jgi:hypothetical protein
MLMLITVLNMSVVSIVARRKGEGDAAGRSAALSRRSSSARFFPSPPRRSALCSVDHSALFRAQPDTIDMAQDYLIIILLGQFFTAIALTVTSAMRGCGDTHISMKINLTANGVNIVFNWLLIGATSVPRAGRGRCGNCHRHWLYRGLCAGRDCTVQTQQLCQCCFGRQLEVPARYLGSMYVVARALFWNSLPCGGLFDVQQNRGVPWHHGFCHPPDLHEHLAHLLFVREGLGIASSSLVGQNLAPSDRIFHHVWQPLAAADALRQLVMCILFIFGGSI